MIKARVALISLAAAGLAYSSTTGPEWHNPDDIPVIEPVTVGLAGEQPADVVRYLLARGALNAKPSPDGSTLAFRHAITGEPQLWLVDAEGGWPTQLSFGSAITFFDWAPDGEHLIVGRDTEGNEREGYYLLSVDGARERQLLPLSDAFLQFGMFSSDGNRFMYSSTARNGLDFDIYVADTASGESTRVFEGSYGFFANAWQPGGDLVIVTETRGEDADDVHLLDMANGELTPLFQPEIAAQFEDFAWLPDGSGFYMSTNVDREFAGLAFYSLDEQEFAYLQTPDVDIGNVVLSGDGRYVAWTSNEDGYSQLHAIDRESRQSLTTPDLPPGVYALEISRRASTLGIRVSGPRTPGDVFVWDIDAGRLAKSVGSSLGGLDPDTFVVPESLRYFARDGVELQGLLYLPDDAAYPYAPPVVVDVHGGPSGQSRPNFEATTQYLVNMGIAVFDVNVRGSSGFGKSYLRLDNREKRLDSVRDLVDTVAFLADDGRVDTTRVAVMGGSYGGFMVNAVLGSYPGVFDAGVSRVGVSDWVRALQDASPGLKASDRVEYGDIRDQRWQDFYREHSPIVNAAKIDVPLLVQHGANDPRDPVAESDRLVTAIRDAGGTVRYMRFPDEGHSLTKHKNRVAYYRAMASFLDEHLRPSHRDVADEDVLGHR